jgi:hypothetical protein
MHQIVTPHEPENMAHALRPALRVETNAVELLRDQLFPKVEICGPETVELIERQRERHLAVAKFVTPPVLIVALKQRTVFGEHHPRPETGDEITVGQVLNNLNNGPFARGFGSAEKRLGYSAQAGRQPRQQLTQNVERVSRAEQVEQRSDVGGGGGCGVSGRIRESHRTSRLR